MDAASDQADKAVLTDAIHKIIHEALGNHNKIFLQTFSTIMKDIFSGFPADQMGPAYFNIQSPGANGSTNNTANRGSARTSAQQLTNTASNFGTTSQTPQSAQKIAPSITRLMKTIDFHTE